MGSMKALKKMKVSRNPFKGKGNRIPPEIIKEGDSAILSWLRNALLSGTEKLDTMKYASVLSSQRRPINLIASSG